MPRKKPAAAPAATPAPAAFPPRIRHQLTAKARCQDALKTLRLNLRGHALLALVEQLDLGMDDLADDWQPVREAVGPLQVGERVQLRPGCIGLAQYRGIAGPFELVNRYDVGRNKLCSVKGDDGVVTVRMPVADLCRAPVDAPVTAADVGRLTDEMFASLDAADPAAGEG